MKTILLLALLLSGCAGQVSRAEFDQLKTFTAHNGDAGQELERITVKNVKIYDDNFTMISEHIDKLTKVILILDKRIEALEAEKGKTSW